jgi:hypothetical protein
MAQKTHIWLCVGVGLLVLTTQAQAQDEQWLQYHSARELRPITGGMNWQMLEPGAEKPSGVNLPQFEGRGQFFAKWPTPMVKSGYLWMSLDRSTKRGPHDRLFIDSNGNGHLNDETVVPAYRTDQSNTYFGPVKVVFQVEDGPVTYHLNFQFNNYNNQARLYASSGAWYEGDITVAGSKKHCVLYDYNANGAFDDKSLEAPKCDRIRIGEKGARDICFVGNYIEIDGVLYRPEIARDGACIKLTKAEDVRLGNIRLPESITEFSAGGENGLFTVKPEGGVGSLPAGKYRIDYWATERKDEKGKQWNLRGSTFSEKGSFDITADEDTELSIGEPLISTITAQNKTGTYSFSHSLKGQLGERIELTRNGSRPQAPKLHIKSKDGTYDRTFSFSYG